MAHPVALAPPSTSTPESPTEVGGFHPRSLQTESSGRLSAQWSRALSKRPLLRREQELTLAWRMRRGDRRAREQFIESNLKLVVSLAKRFRGSGVPIEDLIQEGNVGLVLAVDRFDPSRGFRFSTHATLWIEGAIRRRLAKHKHFVTVPQRTAADLGRLAWVTDELTQRLGREPSAEELAHAMSAPVERIHELHEACPVAASLEELIDDDSALPLPEAIPDAEATPPEDVAVRTALRQELGELLEQLCERYQTVLRLRYGLDGGPEHTLAQIGERLNLSRQRVRQLETAALQQMHRLGSARLEAFTAR